jgi:ACT domain-containing protein
MPLFKGIIFLLGKEVPRNNGEILSVLEEISGVSTNVFKLVLNHKRQKTKPSIDQLNTVFEDYYKVIEKLGEIADALKV